MSINICMRAKEFLDEVVVADIDSWHDTIPLYRKPTYSEFQRVLHEPPHDVRFILLSNDDLFMWNGKEVLHFDALRTIKQHIRSDITPDSPWIGGVIVTASRVETWPGHQPGSLSNYDYYIYFNNSNSINRSILKSPSFKRMTRGKSTYIR